MARFLIEGLENGEEYTYSIESKEPMDVVLSSLIQQGITVTKIVSAKGKHICRYCGDITEGTDEDLLCDDCHQTYGHYKYHEM